MHAIYFGWSCNIYIAEYVLTQFLILAKELYFLAEYTLRMNFSIVFVNICA